MQAHAGRAVRVVDLDRLGEAVEFAFEAELEAAEAALRARADLRQPLVQVRDQRAGRARGGRGRGRVDGALDVLQHLPAHRAGVRRPVAQWPAGLDVRQQQARREGGQVAREVLPVVVVGHTQHAHVEPRVVDQRGLVAPAERIARAAGEPVVGHRLQVGHAAVACLEVAELGAERHAALHADARRESGVAVRRDVPVVRHRGLEAALVVEIDGRGQPARLARIGEREAEHRRTQDRHPHEAQDRAFGDTFVGLEVHAHAVGGEQPRRPAAAVGWAARVGGADRDRTLVVDEVDALGRAAGAGAAEEVCRLQKEAFEALHPQLQLGAGVDVAVLVDAHMAACDGQVFRLVVAEAIGAQDETAAAEFRVAFGDGLEVRAAADLACPQDDGQRLGGVAARGRREGLRRLQRDALGSRVLRRRARGRQRQRSRHRRKARRRSAGNGARATQQGGNESW